MLCMGEPPRLFRNDCPRRSPLGGAAARGHPQRARRSRRRVTLTAAGRARTRVRVGGGSYLTASDPRLLFGLGQATRVESVEVRWPSGLVERFPRSCGRPLHDAARRLGAVAKEPLTVSGKDATVIEFEIGRDVAGRVRVGLLAIEGISVRERDAALDAEVDGACASFRERYGEGRSSEVPGVSDARTLYKALGIDPTKTRPSNEALLRRALKGETLYRINTLVDALNLVRLRRASSCRSASTISSASSRRSPWRRGGPGEA